MGKLCYISMASCVCVKVDYYRRLEWQHLLIEEGRSYRLPYMGLEDGNKKKQQRCEEGDEGSTNTQGLQRTLISQVPLFTEPESYIINAYTWSNVKILAFSEDFCWMSRQKNRYLAPFTAFIHTPPNLYYSQADFIFGVRLW